MKTLADAKYLAEIKSRIGQLSPDNTGQWGSMNVQEMICHLRDAYEIPLGLRTVAPSAPPSIPRGVLKRVALRMPIKWPPGVATMPEIDQRIGGTRPVGFAADLQSLRARLDEFAALQEVTPPHPIFGEMTQAEWMRWGYLHADHHLRQFGR